MGATNRSGRNSGAPALVDDYEVVLRGVAHMLSDFREQIEVVEIDANEPVTTDVDIALYDTFAQPEVDKDGIDALIANPHAHRVVVYTWAFAPDLIEVALGKGASGYLSKTLPASELVDALDRHRRGRGRGQRRPRRVLARSPATTGQVERTG